MSEDKYLTKRSRRSVDSLRGRASGGKLPMYKIKRKKTELFILTPKDEDEDVVFTTYIHKFTQGHGKQFKVLKQCASPAFVREQDAITDLGWEVRKHYGKDDSKAKADFWKQLVADSDDHVLVLDINDVEAGPQIFKMPRKVSEVVISAFTSCMDENDGDLHDYCHPVDGKILVIETNGEDGFARKYVDVFFDETAPSNLFADNIVSEADYDAILSRRPSMEKSPLQPKYSKEEFESYIDFCYEKADELGINLDDLDDKEEEISYSNDSEEDDIDLDIDDSGETEEKEETTSRRSSRGSEETTSRRSSRGGRAARGRRR